MAHNPDINRLNASWHIAGVIDFERLRLLLPRRVSHTLASPDAIVPCLREASSVRRPKLPTCHGMSAPSPYRMLRTTLGYAQTKSQ
ncbi:uncharacterized protein DS421_19g663320 [Arachis hypogaea]|uniref:Uncharacterized protein n=1 Tax=Arachis hypogaea TaxID=3818 RepID=A0A6B9VAV8_ARAHY|nr:uncharacterized protein DS421_19g663320 [Arachis hypogaea]